MNRARFIYWAKCVVALSAVSITLWAFAEGPLPRKTGAPGDGTCNECHVGTGINSSSGKVEITYSGGTSYTPGQRGTFTVTITDTGTPARQAYGFQASARLASDLQKGQAGTLIAGDGLKVICEDNNPAPCKDSGPVQFIEHSRPSGTGVFTFDWTPPAAGAGDVVVYVAANAANGNGNNSGDRIYTANIRLTSGTASGGNKPTISSGGVSNSWSASTTIASNTWVSIYGTDFGAGGNWNGAPEFAQGKLPLSVGGVSVTINGKPAPVYFVNSTQINVLAPDDTATGNVAVVVKTAAGESAPATVVRAPLSPALLTTNAGGATRVLAVLNASNPPVYLGSASIAGTRPFAPGDVVQFYATGLGPTTPAVPVENVVTGAPTLVNAPTIRIRDTALQILGSALVGSGLYQVNAVVPDLPDGDYPASIEVGGTRSPDNIVISIKR